MSVGNSYLHLTYKYIYKLFLKDLHHMCLFFAGGGPSGNPADFKKVLPSAFSAEDWFRWYNKYADGTPIVAPPGYVYPKAGMSPLVYLAPVVVAVVAVFMFKN